MPHDHPSPVLQIPEGYGQISWHWDLNGDPEQISSTCGVSLNGGLAAGQDQVDDAADAMLSAWPAAGMSNQYRFRGATLRCGTGGTDHAIFESNRDVLGLGGSSVLPQNCALLVQKRTASGGRRNRGRMYLPLLSILEGAVSPIGVIDAASEVDAQARATTLWNGLVGGPFLEQPVILHTALPGESAPIPTGITSFRVAPIIATQRRRLRR
jgi:hypothetical protein